MKIVTFKVSGEPANGDLAVLAYTTPHGGMSYATYTIHGAHVDITRDADGNPMLDDNGHVVATRVPTDPPALIATKLAEAINGPNTEFCRGQFNAASVSDVLIVSCTDAVSDVIFISQVQGTGTGKIEQL